MNSNVRYFTAASAKNKDGTLIFGSLEGIVFIDDLRINAINNIMSAYYDEERNQFLLGTLGRVFVTRDFENFEYFDAEDGLLKDHYIQSISKDHQDQYWLGANEGVSRFNWESKSFQNFSPENGKLPSQGIYASFADEFGNLWLGGDNGLLTYNYEHDSIIQISSDLVKTNVKSLSRFDRNYLLVGAKDGLYLLDLKQYGQNGTLDFKIINEASGYSGIEPGFQTFFRDSKERIWVTSATTVNILYPELLVSFDQTLQTHISRINGEQLPHNFEDSIYRNPYGQDYLNLTVSGIGTHQPPVVKFQYELDNTGWSDWLEEEYILISDMSHEIHSLKVRAGPTDLSPDPRFYDRVQFLVSIPFYARTWFAPSVITLLILAIEWGVIVYIRQRIANKKYRSQLVRSRYVPPILIQPFVENSIKHGLLLTERKGNLRVSFEQNNGNLICTISDDGVGRKKSEKIYNKVNPKRKSLGKKIVQERINILNQLGHRIQVDIADNKLSGTVVTLTINDEPK